ncbi:Phage repressor protein C, contains Cro/C1-type HTH and peptisase s24 domains [Paucidesulfovibrio gracilis DSM 16080]|uniref:Phage repressor protein C, contains Cro/C1-type HTH and peptisase s24 domains n=1 Tax=Paucidesulfovibrio gracilis DSM 16080 TaxID=1121449 RepID=A0A1T4WAJ0_9BACT|nr:helix-turn-helix transcriptional regulator [Paucidesulfovibrio gracilis]SKA74058.1 Phage repressor protein C, contains Cro/C1-type HTH and peptisase s24 domains [Paucidesulfovibrio gracilis DSM 16080]
MTGRSFAEFFKRVQHVTELRNQSDLARELGVGRAAVSLAKKKESIPARWILEIAGRYNVDPGWLETGRGQAKPTPHTTTHEPEPMVDDFARIPKVRARLCAGGGSFETEGRVEGYYAFRADWVRRKGDPRAMVLMQVVGNSMEPELQDGDMVLIDQSKTDVYAGGIYAVGVEDTVLVKRIEKLPGQLVLHSDNTDYSPIRLSGDELLNVRIIGKVLWISREYH